MRLLLRLLFATIFVAMIGITTIASLDRSLFDVGRQLLSDRWFQATLCDAYFGFVTFYVWVCYREAGHKGRIIWFVLIMTLGNIAMSVYVLIQLWRLPRDAPLSNLLLRRRIES